MPGKPHQSVLVPYEQEIIALRHRRPPTPYYRISEVLKERHGISVQAPAICKFIKVRAGGRKIFSYGQQQPTTSSPVVKPVTPSPTPARVVTNPPVTPASTSKPKPYFDFPFSETYNLHRLPPEEAKARLKKLEEKEKR